MSKSLALHIEPADTLMFRDGKPFNQNDAGAAIASSIFPPFPPTIVGAVRLALAKEYGFDGRSQETWPVPIVGNGVNWQQGASTGDLNFGAALVLKDGKPYFPVPLNVVEGNGEDLEKELAFLRPGPALSCDLGLDVRLPIQDTSSLSGIKPVNDRWVSREGLESILKFKKPENKYFLKKKELWQEETRVGIGIDQSIRRVNDGQLYMASHIRFADGVTLFINIETTADYDFSKQLMALAGEHRMAAVSNGKDVSQGTMLPACPFLQDSSTNNTLRYAVYHLNPCLMDEMPKPGGILPGFPGKIISACVGKMEMIGGWDSVNRLPIPMRPAISAGSVWFMECNTPEADLLSLHGTYTGQACDWGFGQVLIGRWEEEALI